MVIDRNETEPPESSGSGRSLAEMVSGRYTIIVSTDLSSALCLRKFETQVRMVSAHFKSIFGHFYDFISLQK